jgi:hypothetical protein
MQLISIWWRLVIMHSPSYSWNYISITKKRVYISHGEFVVTNPLQATWLTFKASWLIVSKNVFCKHTSMRAEHIHLLWFTVCATPRSASSGHGSPSHQGIWAGRRTLFQANAPAINAESPTHAVGAIRHCCARPKCTRSRRWSFKHCVRRFSSPGTQNPRPLLLSLSLPPLHSDVPIE